MKLIRRDWTPEEADNWTKEDIIASILSALAYLFLTIGTALSLLALTIGFIIYRNVISLLILKKESRTKFK